MRRIIAYIAFFAMGSHLYAMEPSPEQLSSLSTSENVYKAYQLGNEQSILYLQEGKEEWEKKEKIAEGKIKRLEAEGTQDINLEDAMRITGYSQKQLETKDFDRLHQITKSQQTFMGKLDEHKNALKFIFQNMLQLCKKNIAKYEEKIEQVKLHNASFQKDFDPRNSNMPVHLPKLANSTDPNLLRSKTQGISVSVRHVEWIFENYPNIKKPSTVSLIDDFGSTSEYKFIIMKEKIYPDFFPFYHSSSAVRGFLSDIIATFRKYQDKINYQPTTVFFRTKDSSFPSINEFWDSVHKEYPNGFLHPPTGGAADKETDFPGYWHDHRKDFGPHVLAANLTYYGNAAYKQNIGDPGESALDFYKLSSNVSSVDIGEILKTFLTDMGIDPIRVYRYLQLLEASSLSDKNILYQIFIRKNLVNKLVTLCGPWAEPLKFEKLGQSDTLGVLNLYRTNPESLSFGRNYAGDHLLGRNDIQARILINSDLINPEEVVVFRYTKEKTPLKAMGYEGRLEELVREDVLALQLQKMMGQH